MGWGKPSSENCTGGTSQPVALESDRWSGRFLIGVELDASEESIGPIVLWEIHRLQDGAQESKILGLAKQYFGWTR